MKHKRYKKMFSFFFRKLHLIAALFWILIRTKAQGEAVTQRRSVKKVFLEVSQNSQENTCARVSFLIKLQASDLQLY